MISLDKVITLDGELINLGEWDYMPYSDEVIGNPFPGPMSAPADWDFQITYIPRVGNPLPEGAIEEEQDVFFDRVGKLRLVAQAAEYEKITRLAKAKEELSLLMPKVQLGLATDEQKARSVELYLLVEELESTQ